MEMPSPADLTIYTCLEDAGVPVGTRGGPYLRQFYVIECCTEGEARHIVKGKAYPLSAGQAMVFFPGDATIHETVGTVPRRGWWCYIGGRLVEEPFRAAGIRRESPYLKPRAAAAVTKLLKQIAEMRFENDAGAELRRLGLMHVALGEILRSAPAKIEGSVYVLRAVGIMESRYAEDLSVAQIARDIGLDRSYFSTLFRRETGLSPKESLTQLRVRRASDLLLTTDLPVAEVALACGFQPESFSRVFKKKTGKNPLAFRRRK